MSNVGFATLQIIPSTRGLQGALDGAVNPALGRSGQNGGRALTGGIMSSVGKMAGPLAAIFGTEKLISGLRGSIEAASDFSETLNKSNVIFGDNAGTIEKWSQGSVRMLGVSQSAALATAAQFGDMFKQIGFGSGDVAKLSTDFIKLSADIGSFQNASTDDVTSAFQSALRGEYESIQRFLPGLKGARVETEALALSGKSAAKELTAQDKAMALYSLATKDGASASNDFAETQGGLAGQQKIFAANLENLKVKLGTVLLPTINGVMVAFNSGLLPAVQTITGAIKGLWDIFANGNFSGGLSFLGIEEDSATVAFLFNIRDAAISIFNILFKGDFTGGFFGIEEDSPIIAALFKIREGAISLFNALKPVGEFIANNITPILHVVAGVMGGVLLAAVVSVAGFIGGALVSGLIALVSVLASPVVLIGALVGALIYAYTHFEGFRAVVDSVVQFVLNTVVPGFIEFAGKVREVIGDAVAYVKEIWPQIQEAIGHVIETVKTIIDVFVNVVRALWKTWGDDLLSLVKAAWDFIKDSVSNALDLIKGVITTVLAVINGDWGRAWDGLKAIASAFWDQLKNIVDLAWEAIKALFGAAWSALKAVVETGWDTITSLFDSAWESIKSGVSSAWDAVKGLFTDAWTALKTAVSTGISSAVELVEALPGKFKSALSSLAGALKDVAKAAWDAFDGAVDTGIAAVIRTVKGLPGQIVSGIGNLGDLLAGAGRALLDGLIGGIGDKLGALREMMGSVASTIKGFLPGSPVKTGPLTSWNNGGAGKRLMGLLGDGIQSGIPGIRSTLDKGLGDLHLSDSLPTLAESGVRFRAANGTEVGGSTGSKVATQADVVAAIEHLEVRFAEEVRRQTDRTVLLTRTGVHR